MPKRRPTVPYAEDYGAGVNWRHFEGRTKLKGWDLWKSLGSPKLVAAPMVEASELPYRQLMREYGTELTYTPMFHSLHFSRDPKYRALNFTTSKEDTNLFVQFCANDPEALLESARYVEGHCDAVDINFGCPQNIAKRGHYGSFLMEDWDLVRSLVSTLAENLETVPVTAKIRVYQDPLHTVEYAKMIEAAGASVLTVHGRTRDMRGAATGLADWEKIRLVREAVTIPMIANGNILTGKDVEPCLEATKADAVMSAEGLLWDPRLYSKPENPLLTGRDYILSGSVRKESLDVADRYLELCDQYNFEHYSCIKGHLYKLLHHSFEAHTQIRDSLNENIPHEGCVKCFQGVVKNLREAEVEQFAQPPLVERKEATRDVNVIQQRWDKQNLTEEVAGDIGGLWGEEGE